MKIYKQELKTTDKQTLRLESCKILKFAEQDGKLMMWYVHDDSMDLSMFIIRIVGTGHEHSDLISGYFDTVLMSNGLVWHIYVN